ncbi:YjiH family protein [Alkalicoccobacillus murimartini]|uniref:Nucleoside recognition membrane protein YjiH n=1 Tax=Alkalicoccobacillus murimartini TaxID=171685 RepID=A0ABT9YK10_9BACI|nr:YjiH family protein [Alkalicoccobacillus murimartini]MDQ0207984.1 nucleoside recognition membrane protein YjiH [Alkalicoccobacillus murimartini]
MIDTKTGNHKKHVLLFLIPSIIGALLFLIPLPIGDGRQWTVIIAYISSNIENFVSSFITELLVVVLLLSSIGALIGGMLKPSWMVNQPFLKGLFVIHPFWLLIRCLGAVFAILTLLEVGPEVVIGTGTGQEVLYFLLPVLAVWSFVMGMLLPLLIEFGLMEWLGTLAQKIMRPLFKLPGRAAVDSMASWMGNNMVSILITINQYESGYYSKRESAIIVTNFTITSIGFSLIVARMLNIENLFPPFYLTVLVGVCVAAIICPRIPPLSRMKDGYYEPVGKQIVEEVPENTSIPKWAFQKGVAKASNVPSPTVLVKKGLFNAMDIWFGMLPLVMGIGTIALMIANFTPVFQIISYPLIPVLELMQIPEASTAAPAMLIGFADMFLPAILGSNIESELTRFVVGAVSLTQLIYMSEIGVMLIRSSIPVNIGQLFLMFIIRTIITLPIVVLIAHLFVF